MLGPYQPGLPGRLGGALSARNGRLMVELGPPVGRLGHRLPSPAFTPPEERREEQGVADL
jgi:hypothetical protein